MNSRGQDDTGSLGQVPPQRHQWLPIMSVVPGMVVARPVVGLSGVRETMYIAIGSPISTQTIAQLIVKGVECLAVIAPDDVETHVVADLVNSRISRLQEIFGNEPNESCRKLMTALASAGTSLC